MYAKAGPRRLFDHVEGYDVVERLPTDVTHFDVPLLKLAINYETDAMGRRK